jgi:hypothetical protein
MDRVSFSASNGTPQGAFDQDANQMASLSGGAANIGNGIGRSLGQSGGGGIGFFTGCLADQGCPGRFYQQGRGRDGRQSNSGSGDLGLIGI